MPNYLWKVTAKMNVAKVSKGMSAEIIISNNTRKPSLKEIADAINEKYNVGIKDSNCGSTSFESEKIS